MRKTAMATWTEVEGLHQEMFNAVTEYTRGSDPQVYFSKREEVTRKAVALILRELRKPLDETTLREPLEDWLSRQVRERIVELRPAYDRRSADPSKDYGVHGVELLFVLKGREGAVQFLLYTNWYLPHVQEELDKRFLLRPDRVGVRCHCHPMPADLGYHSPHPMYKGHKPTTESCPYLDGRLCYYDGSGLAAERIYEVLLRTGSDGVWAELESYYASVFKTNPPLGGGS